MRVIINNRISLPVTSMNNGLQAPRGFDGTETDLVPYLNITFPYSKAIYDTLIELFEDKIPITNLEFQNDVEDVVFVINEPHLKFAYIQHYLDNMVNSINTKWIEINPEDEIMEDMGEE